MAVNYEDSSANFTQLAVVNFAKGLIEGVGGLDGEKIMRLVKMPSQQRVPVIPQIIYLGRII